MTLTEIIGSVVILFLTYLLYQRKNSAEIAKTEIEVMQKALSTLGEFTNQLTERVHELTAQVNTLTNINEKLQLEVSNLESILKHKS